jgi:hypothetical protein
MIENHCDEARRAATLMELLSWGIQVRRGQDWSGVVRTGPARSGGHGMVLRGSARRGRFR